MYTCERCASPMDIEVTSNKRESKCRRTRQCPRCGRVSETTEISTEAFNTLLEKRAMELAKKKLADTLELLGIRMPKQHM